MYEDANQTAEPGEAPAGEGHPEKLMESGRVWLDTGACGECQVKRGMPVISTDGEEVGWVAGVVLGEADSAAAVLLARRQVAVQYYLLPPALIGAVNDGQVQLRVSTPTADGLSRKQAS